MARVQAGAPALVAEGRIGDHVVEGLELAGRVGEKRVGQRVALHDERRGVVVQDHVHAGQAGCGRVLLLPVERDLRAGGIAHLQQQRTRAAGRVIDGRWRSCPGVADADDLRHDAADLGGRVELALALAALGGEVPHQVFVGVAQDVVAVSAVLREVERGVLEDGDEVGEPVHLLLAVAELGGVVEVRHVGQLVGSGQRPEDLLVDLVADVGLALEGHHVLEAGARRNRDRGVGHAGVLVADVLDEQQHQHVVLVLAGIHAAAQLVAAGPEGGVEFGFFQGHASLSSSVESVTCWPHPNTKGLPAQRICAGRSVLFGVAHLGQAGVIAGRKVGRGLRLGRTGALRGRAGIPKSMPVALISSSMSGQCTPNPLPMISKLLRCAGVASDKRQRHARGTLIVRPSTNRAVITSSVTCMSMMRGISLTTVFIPSLQDRWSVLSNKLANTIQLSRWEPFVETECDRLQPEFADHSFTPNMHMLRLIAVEAIEE